MRNDALILELAAGDPAAVAWITAAARVVVAQGGDISLEQAARLANTAGGRRRGLRDAYLRRAAVELGGGVAVGPKELHATVERFRVTRWEQWKDRRLPPDYACSTEVALFHALRLGDVPSTPQGIGRILAGNENGVN